MLPDSYFGLIGRCLPNLHAFHFQRSPKVHIKWRDQLVAKSFRYLNLIGNASRLHAAGHVDGIPPQVVDVLTGADDSATTAPR